LSVASVDTTLSEARAFPLDELLGDCDDDDDDNDDVVDGFGAAFEDGADEASREDGMAAEASAR